MANLVIGLTGGIGSGKSAACRFFADKGIDIVDADIIARQVVAPGSQALKQISQRFSASIITSTGELDRQQLRNIVFKDVKQKEWLNQLLHPLIRQEMSSAVNACQSTYCILAIPLLIENELFDLVNRVAVIDCEVEQQKQRALLRDNSDATVIQAIIDSQVSREVRLKHANDIIDNSKDLDYLAQQISKMHEFYLSLV
ncbi:dephospho-CoA kinase [Saccharobesus litoralis]|uniref:Dephospho-CoA kinase n=1 Tax=Saccharobesus litoralis TaxID=2172099 RepID=A0A2S0VWZ4_9ALTE|nr:dephospho-CoA kinase [Saccharobesus litoralis]AWB68728.1 dephospho-CoA kinase [Saccharobesus litoralis]